MAEIRIKDVPAEVLRELKKAAVDADETLRAHCLRKLGHPLEKERGNSSRLVSDSQEKVSIPRPPKVRDVNPEPVHAVTGAPQRKHALGCTCFICQSPIKERSAKK